MNVQNLKYVSAPWDIFSWFCSCVHFSTLWLKYCPSSSLKNMLHFSNLLQQHSCLLYIRVTTYCSVCMAPWLIRTGSRLDDWIYYHLLVQCIVITINYSAIANLSTSQITRKCSILICFLRFSFSVHESHGKHPVLLAKPVYRPVS
jgi:hypothetical protein